jgi:hypothetical protein
VAAARYEGLVAAATRREEVAEARAQQVADQLSFWKREFTQKATEVSRLEREALMRKEQDEERNLGDRDLGHSALELAEAEAKVEKSMLQESEAQRRSDELVRKVNDLLQQVGTLERERARALLVGHDGKSLAETSAKRLELQQPVDDLYPAARRVAQRDSADSETRREVPDQVAAPPLAHHAWEEDPLVDRDEVMVKGVDLMSMSQPVPKSPDRFGVNPIEYSRGPDSARSANALRQEVIWNPGKISTPLSLSRSPYISPLNSPSGQSAPPLQARRPSPPQPPRNPVGAPRVLSQGQPR